MDRRRRVGPTGEKSKSGPVSKQSFVTLKPGTEQANPVSTNIDSLDTIGILQTIHSQDALVASAVGSALDQITRCVDAAVRAIGRGGRLIYVGAGTSGRLGVMDAAECPPTFGVSAKTVVAVIAGGKKALYRAVESAEDDAEQGRFDLEELQVGKDDVVVGLSASGGTPYTLEALDCARVHGAATAAVTSNADSPLARKARIAIVARTGPEVIAGSTRMKAALAQKMILQMISTATMIRLGYVYRNYMVGVRPTNQKLDERACGIISEITGAGRLKARVALTEAGQDLKLAIVMLIKSLNRTAAAKLLEKNKGNLRRII
jgi:N-acetylmuramic acid 6-phosphate etherase